MPSAILTAIGAALIAAAAEKLLDQLYWPALIGFSAGLPFTAVGATGIAVHRKWIRVNLVKRAIHYIRKQRRIFFWLVACALIVLTTSYYFLWRPHIYDPKNGETVRARQIVHGKSPWEHLNNYLVVTDEPFDQHYVQGPELSLDEAGGWERQANFGEARQCGISFLIQFFATRETVPSGLIYNFPKGAVFSPGIKVHREACQNQ